MLAEGVQIIFYSFFHLLRPVPVLLFYNPSVNADKIGIIRPRSVATPDRVIHLVYQDRNAYVIFPGACRCEFCTFLVSSRVCRAIGMCLDSIHDDESNLVAIPGVECLVGRNTLPKGRSGVRPENHDNGLFRYKL